MPSKNNSQAGRRPGPILWVAALLLLSVGLGVFVTWRVPALELHARNWLTRARGPLPVPDDIAIVAIDEASLARFGRSPWLRRLERQETSSPRASSHARNQVVSPGFAHCPPSKRQQRGLDTCMFRP